MSIRPAPLRVSTSLAILAFDWLVLALNLTTHVHDFASSTILGACGAVLTVAIIEQQKQATFTQTLVRALVAGAIVAVPLPILGSLVAATFLIWSAVAHGQAQRTH